MLRNTQKQSAEYLVEKNGTKMLRRHWEDIVAYENMCYVLSLSSSSFNARHNGLPTAISLHAQRLPLGPDRSMTTQNDLQIIAKTTCLHSRSIKSMLIVVLCTRIVSIYQPKYVHIYIFYYWYIYVWYCPNGAAFTWIFCDGIIIGQVNRERWSEPSRISYRDYVVQYHHFASLSCVAEKSIRTDGVKEEKNVHTSFRFVLIMPYNFFFSASHVYASIGIACMNGARTNVWGEEKKIKYRKKWNIMQTHVSTHTTQPREK